jgi:hypothetical protein
MALHDMMQVKLKLAITINVQMIDVSTTRTYYDRPRPGHLGDALLFARSGRCIRSHASKEVSAVEDR